MDLSALRQHPFVRTLDDHQLQLLLPCIREVRFGENEMVFREGGEADRFFLLHSGCVALEQHLPGRGVVTIESICPGDILGLSWLFPEHHWLLDARCLEPVHAFVLHAECVRERMQASEPLGIELLTHVVQALYQRLARVRLQRLDVYKAGA